MSTTAYPMTPRELAAKLRIDVKYLRAEIREHNLVPAHKYGAHYHLSEDDVRRIEQHFNS
jgi:hypothetical protein